MHLKVCKALGRRDGRPHLDLFEDFGDGFTVEFLTGLLVGGEDLLQRHVVSCENRAQQTG